MRGQSTLEYLVTYGWAVFAVIIVAFLLNAFGAFDSLGWRSTVSVKDLVLNSTPDFKDCVELNAESFVCSQANGYRVKVDCERLKEGVYCASNPLVKVGVLKP